MIGNRLAHYEILELLGSGGMGHVYRARDTKLDRDVAVKVLPEAFAGDAERLARFGREAKTVAGLNHPNIVVIHSVERDAATDFITMELVSGCDLADRIPAGGFSLDELLDVAIPLADAVGAAHRNGITHRDLKPSNVMITDDGRVKVLDFGLATSPERDPTSGAPTEPDSATALETVAGDLTEAGRVLGTVAYMSPEQAEGLGVDQRSDVFALGIMLYEMATGRRPFQGETRLSLLSSIVTDTPPPISDVRPRLPGALDRIVRRCLEKRPDDRYQSVVDLRNDLREVAADAGLGAGPRGPETGSHSLIQRPAWMVAAAALVLAAFLGYVWFFSGDVVADAGTVAVMPFENLVDPTDERQLGGMMTDLVRGHLSQSDELTVVSGYRLYDIHRQLSNEPVVFDLSLAGEVARRAGAEVMVLGRIRAVGNETFVVTELVDVATGQSRSSPQTVGAGERDVFAMAQALATELRAQLLPADAEAAAVPASVEAGGGTDDIEALRAFHRGEALLRNGDLQGAIGQFEAAVELDPDFHRPWYQLAMLGLWTDVEESVQRRAADRLAELIDRFPPDERAAVNGLLLYSAGDLSGSVPVYEQYLSNHPEDKFALYVLGEAYAHSARDYDLVRSAQIFARALELDPSFSLAFIDIPYNYGFAGDLPRAYESIARWEREHPALAQEAIAALNALEGDLDGSLEQLTGVDTPISLLLEPSIGLLAGRWQLTESQLDALEGSPQNWWRAWLLRIRGDLGVYRGRLTEAAAAYEQGGAAMDYEPHEGIVQGGHPASSLRALAQLRALGGDLQGAREAAERALSIQPESPRRLYFAGLFALRAGDEAAAEARLETIATLLSSIRSSAGWIYRDALQAEILLSRGQPAAAVELLEGVLASDALLDDFFVDWSTGALTFREALARAHIATGDPRQAVTVLETMLQTTFERMNHPVPETLAYYKLGVLHEEAGNEAASGRYLRAFLDRWGAADWDLDEVADARLRLGELAGSPPPR